MDWQEERKKRKHDSAEVCALGLFKALRNFVDPLMQSYSKYADYRPKVVEALGDMLMYLAGVGRLTAYERVTLLDAQDAVASLATQFAYVLDSRNSDSLRLAYGTVLATMDLLCITEQEAIECSLAKL